MATVPGPSVPAPVRPAGGFVGRRAELAAVAAAWDDARGGAARIVAVEGGSGAGKTVLITRATARTGAAAVTVVTAGESETGLRWGLVDQLVRALPPGPPACSPLLRPDRGDRADPWAVGAELLAALPTDEPLVLVLDDVQWADDASRRALLFVLRRLHHDRVLVLLGLRVPESGEGVDAEWDRLLATHAGASRLRLDGLAAAELSELAAAMGRPLGSTGAARRLREHTHGHPLHARALIDELPTDLLAGTVDVLPAPRSLAAVVLVRLARASPAARDLVVAASVLGATCALHHAAALAGLADPLPALEEAVGLGLLAERVGDRPPQVGFVHPLLRAAVHRDLPPTRRRDLHRRAATLLSGVAALRHRVLAADGPAPALADEIEAFVTGPTAEVGGTGAADLWRAAADLSTEPADRERRQAAAVARLVADGEIARALALEPMVERWRPGRRRSAVLGQLALFSGRFVPARACLETALDGADADAVVAAHLALLDVLEGHPERAVEHAGTALAAAAGDPAVRLPAGMALVLGLAASGRRDAARVVLDAAGPGDSGPVPVDVLLGRGVLDALAGDDEAAVGHLDEALRRARAGEPMRAPGLGMAFLPASQDRLGIGEGVVEACELAVAVTRDGGTVLPGTIARAAAAEALAVRGRFDEARAHLDAVADGPRWWGAVVCLAVATAVLADAEDDPAAVLAALDPALDPSIRALTDGLGLLAPRVLEIDALLGTGRRSDAAAALDVLDARLDRTRPSRYAVDAARLRVRLGAGRVPGGLTDLGLDRVRAPWAVARFEIELGRRLLDAGDRRGGVDLLRAARERLVPLGAVPWRRRCDALLHAAGLTPSSGDGSLGLTSHEEAVVALVARGLTNREIGRDLYVTPRTVAYHLSNVYAKLGVTSRRELVRLRNP